jgi:hypothetical protein
MRTPPQVVERLATEGLLDHATCLRCILIGHARTDAHTKNIRLSSYLANPLSMTQN